MGESVNKKFFIFTEIEGVKHYVRRVHHGKYTTAVTMLCTNWGKALDFGSIEKATKILDRMGIGKAIEVKEINNGK